MDFRNTQPQASHPGTPTSTPVSPNKSSRISDSTSKWFRTAAVALLFCTTIVLVALIGVLVFSKSSDQSKFVQKKNYQAVFLTNGQVYFGNITDLGHDYIKLQNIYYLTQNTTTDSKGNTTTDGNYTLVKLGCQQIHDPFDAMVIERAQVSFWENLQDGGKVVKSIQAFQKQNPKGPDCSQVSNQTQADNNSNTQGSNSNTSNSTTTKP